MIEDYTLLALNISTIVVMIFSANLLILRAFERQTYLPLAIFLLAIAIVVCQPTIAVLAPQLQPIFLVLSLPAILLIGPSFWFYVQGLTCETPWKFSRKSARHFIPFGIGAFIALTAIALPAEIRNALLVDGNEDILESAPAILRNLIYVMLTTTFVLVLAWVIQSAFYFYKIIQRLSHYRAHLKDLFASTESKEIRWLTWLLFSVGAVWLASIIHIILDNLIFSVQWNALLFNSVIFVMIWSVSIWGLRQKPGLEELYESKNKPEETISQEDDSQEKYQRSALNEQQSSQIATKIEKAMQEDKLYLDASLSLQKLAKHICTSPNYISQTLNESLGMNFFDYVNKHRIQEAKERLRQSKETVLDIAMSVGFNAKSSFYSSFKKETQQTPSQYRKQCALQ